MAADESFRAAPVVEPSGGREPPWVIRQVVGSGTAAQTHERLSLLLAQGQTELALAFDEPTRMGLDSDSPRALGEVGMTGVAIDTVDDLDVLLHHVALDRVAIHLGIDGPGVVLLGFYLALADERGVARPALAGSVQNDCFREFLVPRGWVAPPAGALRLVGDVIAFCDRELPRWSPVSVDGQALREAGASAAHEIAFALAAALAYLDAGVARGLDVAQVAARLSLSLDVHHDFFEEIAKFRAALLTERYGVSIHGNLGLHARTSTVLTTPTPRLNVVRAALQSLAAVLGGAQSLHTATRDEANAPPTEQDLLLAVRTQQILADESGVAASLDPLGGSPHVERLTTQLESEALAHLRRIATEGGLAAAIAKGSPQRELAVASHQQQRLIETRHRVLVGVNRHTEPLSDTPESLPLPIDDEPQRRQQTSLAQVKATRDAGQVATCLAEVRAAVQSDANVLPSIIAAGRARCTLQEVCDVLRDVLGTHDEELNF